MKLSVLPTESTSSQPHHRIQFRYKKDSHFGIVVDYLSRTGHDVNQELIETLKTRFLIEALSREEEVDQNLALQNLALQCVSKLQGYIYVIEQLAGLKSSTEQIVNNKLREAVALAEDNEEDDKTEAIDPESTFNQLDQMFGLAK